MLKNSGRPIRCEIYGCGKVTNYRFGKENMPTSGDLIICEDCMLLIIKDLVENMPAEYIDKIKEIISVNNKPAEQKRLPMITEMTRQELIDYAKELGVQGKLVTFKSEQLLTEILKIEGR